jgi:hypothetical protein
VGKGGGREEGGEMTQTLYAHMNKKRRKKKKHVWWFMLIIPATQEASPDKKLIRSHLNQ